MSGRIILCADDYALTPGISQAIRMLAAANCISATSAIVTRPQWMREAAALRPLLSDIAAGLHLNLTLGTPIGGVRSYRYNRSFPGIKAIILSAQLGRLNSEAVTAEIESQLDAFEAGIGASPDFVDGHEHVHVLPVVRASLLAILKRRYGGKPLLVRDPSPSFEQIVWHTVPRWKSMVLRALARNMRRDIERHGFICNDRFAGISTFTATAAAVARDFDSASEIEGWRALAMCHPGFPDIELSRSGALAQRRQLEFNALMGPSSLVRNLWRPSRTIDGCVQWPGSKLEQSA